MTPRFILPANYAERDMMLVLSRSNNGKGWKFYGHADGYSVPARNHRHEVLCAGTEFATKAEAAMMARALNLPAYAIWNGRKRRYDGQGEIIRAYPRNAKDFGGLPLAGIRKEY
jgi:hypothetical protein